MILENVEVTYKRFFGEKLNPYFEIHLSPNVAKTLIVEGWDVWTYTSTLRVYIQFNLSPRIFLITKMGKTQLYSNEELALLENVKFEKVDISIQSYKFKDGRTTAKRACVSSMYVTVKE